MNVKLIVEKNYVDIHASEEIIGFIREYFDPYYSVQCGCFEIENSQMIKTIIVTEGNIKKSQQVSEFSGICCFIFCNTAAPEQSCAVFLYTLLWCVRAVSAVFIGNAVYFQYHTFHLLSVIYNKDFVQA